MTSLARGLAVIRAFSQQQRDVSVAQISAQTGITRAAVRRCLHTLERLGYVSARDRRYSLRRRILSLGHAYLTSARLPATAQRFAAMNVGTQAARVPIRALEGRILPQLRAAAADLGLLLAGSP